MQKKDHIEQANRRLLEQFKDKENIEGLLHGWMTAVNQTEESVMAVLDSQSINDAKDYQLDNLGKIVGANRGGRDDDAYRDRIKLQVLINTSQGTSSDILEILALLTNATYVKTYPHYPMGGNLYTNGDEIPEGLADTIQDATPIAHGIAHIYHDPEDNAFTPVELVQAEGVLVDNKGDEIVDNEGNNIAVNGLAAELNRNPWRATLKELNEDNQSGIPCEILN